MNNTSSLVCNGVENMYKLSDFCLDNPEYFFTNICRPSNENVVLVKLGHAYNVINLFFGITGNLLTVLALPYAVRKRK